MLFREISVKNKRPDILAQFIREALNLELQLDLNRGFDNWQFEGSLYLAVRVIMVRKTKIAEKSCDFVQL